MSESGKRDIIVPSLLALSASLALSTMYMISKCNKMKQKERVSKEYAGASAYYKDSTLYYGDESTLHQTSQSKKRLPKELYSYMVQNSIICCVDILLIRTNPMTKKEECLLVQRATEPVKGLWWYPGGRMFKGETFFDTAIRKMKEETGIHESKAKAVQILGTYNTMFPTSVWDTDDEKGTHTVQPIILVTLPEDDDKVYHVLLDDTSENHKWIDVDPSKAEENGEDKYVLEGLRRYAAWNETFGCS